MPRWADRTALLEEIEQRESEWHAVQKKDADYYEQSRREYEALSEKYEHPEDPTDLSWSYQHVAEVLRDQPWEAHDALTHNTETISEMSIGPVVEVCNDCDHVGCPEPGCKGGYITDGYDDWPCPKCACECGMYGGKFKEHACLTWPDGTHVPPPPAPPAHENPGKPSERKAALQKAFEARRPPRVRRPPSARSRARQDGAMPKPPHHWAVHLMPRFLQRRYWDWAIRHEDEWIHG